jgi:copper chaperone CopZ
VQSALAKVGGVRDAKVVFRSGKATVTVDKGKVSPEQLEQAVANLGGGYKAKKQ